MNNNYPKNRIKFKNDLVGFEFVGGDTFYYIPRIVDVQIIKERVVVIYFADGTEEKAILSEDDSFSFEQGISICLMKKMFSLSSRRNQGSSMYNKLINYAKKVYRDNREADSKAELAAKNDAEKIEKLKAKAKARKAKRLAAQREEQIEIQKEAYLRAMKEFKES